MELTTHNIDTLRLRSLMRFRATAAGQVVQAAIEDRYQSLDATENRARIADVLEPFVFGLETDMYTRFRGDVRSAGRLDTVIATLTLESEHLGAMDRFTFRLQYDPATQQFDLVESEKLPQGFGADGCVPMKMRAMFNPMVVKDETVFEVAERYGRVIDEREIRWDWQPRWNYAHARLSGRLAENTLESLLPAQEEMPAYLLLATWSFRTQKRDWGEEGRFVRVVIDPQKEEAIHRVGDEWCLLY